MSDAKKSGEDALEAVASVMTWGILFGFIVLAVAHGYYLWQVGAWINEPDKLGQLGDFIGGVTNPLLSFIGLIALFTTVMLQTKQLQLSRKELEATREELAKSATAQQATADVMSKQLVEAEKAARAQLNTSRHQARTAAYTHTQLNYSRATARAQVLSLELAAVDAPLGNHDLFKRLQNEGQVSIGQLVQRRAELMKRLYEVSDYLEKPVVPPETDEDGSATDRL